MKRLLPLITLCSFLAFFSSCGQKGSTTNANVTIVAGGFTGAIPGQTGGTMLLGYSPSLGASFSKVFDGTPMELDNGRWDFAAISWSGNGAGDILQGQVRCAISRGNNLTGGEANVALSLSTANCADPLFGAKNTKNAGGEPLPLIPTVCAGPEGLRESDPTACKNSTPLSYRVIFPGKDLGGSPRPGLVSTCVAEESPQDTAPMENINEQIKIPLVLPGPWNFPVIIELYDDATCSTGLDRVVVFNVYTGEANRGQAELDDQGAYAGTKNEIKITKNPCSSLAGLQSTPFALSTSPLTYAICTPEQFIGILSAPNDNYELYGDLDFTSYGDFADPVIDGDFTGQFDGRGRTIRNVSFDQTTTNATGLFRQIDGTGTFNDGQANVKNLTLEGFTISSSGNSNGALAGNILIGSEVRNIRLNNITLNLNATTSSHGALAGSLTNVAGTGNGGGNSRVNRIYANNIQINTTANASKIGGLIGSVDGNGNGVELSESLVKGVTIRTNTSTPTIIGGVVGEQIASSSIKDVTATGVSIGVSGSNLSTGTNQVGGFAGLVQNSEVKNSKSVATIYGGGNEVGGFIGASYGSDISNVVSIINMETTTAGTNTGGLIGNVNVIAGSPASLTEARSFGTVRCVQGNCGGLIGNVNVIAGSPASLTEARSFGTVRCDQGNCGGLIGNLDRGLAATVQISSSYSKAEVISAGDKVGGLIGYVNSTLGTNAIAISDVAAFGNVTGASNVGGLIGDFRFGTITNAYSRNNVTAIGAGPAAGLVADYRNGDLNTSYTDSTVSGTGVADCIASTGTLGTTANVYHVSDGAVDGDCDGAVAIGDTDTLTAFTNFTAPPWREGTGDSLALDIVATLEALGEEYTGSRTDPFILTTPEQWDAIGDKPPLMTKTFRLGANISFGNGSFVPIGSVANPFAGHFQGNNYAIMDINYTDSGAEPLGLFRVIGTSLDGNSTRIEHEDLFDRSKKYKLYISNVNLSKAPSQGGPAGALAGRIVDDGSDPDGPGPLSFHDNRTAIKITGVEIDNSRVDGGKQPAASPVGGIAGRFDHTNDQTEIRNLRLFSTEVYSGNQNTGTGGLFGGVFGPLANSSTSYRRFSTFILDDMVVQATGASADHVGGAIGQMTTQTAEWEQFIVSNSTVSSPNASSVGGIIGDLFGFGITEGSFSGTVTGDVFVGGIAGELRIGSNITGFIAQANVNATINMAGCLVGQASTNTTVSNSIANCSSVTSGGTSSYFGNGAYGAPAQPSIYTTPLSDEGLGANRVYTTFDDFVNPSFLSTYLIATDPWVFTPGAPPVPYWVIFPEVLEKD